MIPRLRHAFAEEVRNRNEVYSAPKAFGLKDMVWHFKTDLIALSFEV